MKKHALAVALALVASSPAFAASDYLLQLDGVKGESKASIDVLSWSWGTTNTSSIGNSGAAGKLRGGINVAAGDINGDGYADLARLGQFDSVSEFTFTVDGSPPVLAALCAKGKHIPQAVLTARGESFALTDATVVKCDKLMGPRMSSNRAPSSMATSGLNTNPYAITVTGSMKHTKTGHVTLLK